MTLSVPEQLVELLGDGYAVRPERLPDYAVDGLIPRAVVRPTSREAIAGVLRWAAAEKLAVIPRGGGTQLSLGNLPQRADLVLDLSSYNRLLDYQPADLTATVESGMTLEALQRELAQAGKLAPLEAPVPQKATIGGILASSASGPLRHSYGLARDWLIGISVVGADGVETRAGGKVVKNVTGYDLNKLYAGSLGTLGVIVEATFKLAPVPTDTGAVVAVLPSLQQGIEASRELLARVFSPQGLQVVNASTAAQLPMPIAISGDAAVVLAHFAGRARAVQRRMDECSRELQSRGATALEKLERDSAARLLRELTDLGWTDDPVPQLVLKVNLSPTEVSEAVSWPGEVSPAVMPGIVADPGFGGLRMLWWHFPGGGTLNDPTAIDIIRRVRERAQTCGGSAIVERCSLPVKEEIDVWGGPPELQELTRRIKHRFDPSGVLNPGRFVGKL